ncbi:hypothetical protein ACH5RR_001198 [Cinchona calisaya]|uniref:Uncharacterized protein n=1 Tax=Cinchona calisaya TaxID=153742 RepID=A0ABD3B2Q4_9GENT
MQELLHDAFGFNTENVPRDSGINFGSEQPNLEADKFYKLVDDSRQELWLGRKNFSKLPLLVRLLHLKCLGKISDKIFTILLDLLREAFPEGVKLPKYDYEAKKVIKE